MTKAILGIIGGSGIYDLPGLEKVRQKKIKSPWGEPSAPLRVGEIAGTPVVFLDLETRGADGIARARVVLGLGNPSLERISERRRRYVSVGARRSLECDGCHGELGPGSASDTSNGRTDVGIGIGGVE